MTKIVEDYPLGDLENLTSEELARRLQEMYRQLARAINQKPDVFIRATEDGQATDTFASLGDITVNQNTPKVEILTEQTDPSTVVWTTIS
jgi:hypothetical protein